MNDDRTKETTTDARGALILSAWDQIAADRCCDRRTECRHLTPLDRLARCTCLASAARRVREREDALDELGRLDGEIP